jgi:lysophospholipase L1-like esterase
MESFRRECSGLPKRARPRRSLARVLGLVVAWTGLVAASRGERADLIVAPDGSGNFTTIQAALDALPGRAATNRTILIRNGIYREKLFITKSHLSLVGEDRERTRIEYAELRRLWREKHPDDWGAAVVNIGDDVTDLVIANLTVRNDYGSRHGDHDHQFAIRSGGESTRIAILSARILADGGDTLSLWNSRNGLSYHADCDFEGWVDFVCPRGWCYITDSRFFGHNLNASIWHDGSRDPDQKLVIRSSRFDGVPGFPLGRYHRDAQIYLLDARFSSAMADRPICPASPPGSYAWGERIYYDGCHRDGGDYAWFADNLGEAHEALHAEQITPEWTFGGRWDPEATLPAVLPFPSIPRPRNEATAVPASGVLLRWTAGRNATSHDVFLGTEDPPPLAACRQGSDFRTGPLAEGTTSHWRVAARTAEGRIAGSSWRFTTAGSPPRGGGPRGATRTAELPPIQIALAGDSTVTDEQGWGAGFRAHLSERATIVNFARNGRSSKSYMVEGHWADLLAARPDYVLIQFGHNDMPGKGKNRETDPEAYRANLGRMVGEARAAGITPVIVTSLSRRLFGPDGRIRSDLSAHADAATAVAAAKGVPSIDLHALSIQRLDALGPAAALPLGLTKPDGSLDKTHLSKRGSELFGGIVAGELACAVPALAPYVRPE